MSYYKTTLRIIVPVVVEAESLGEAERIIDGVVDNAGEVWVYEGTQPDHVDAVFVEALYGDKPERIERDAIKRV